MVWCGMVWYGCRVTGALSCAGMTRQVSPAEERADDREGEVVARGDERHVDVVLVPAGGYTKCTDYSPAVVAPR
jgi:hypothetical protein